MSTRAMTDKEFRRIVDEAWEEFRGNTETFSAAVGALMLGRIVGWQGIRCVHSHPRYQKFQKILRVRFADVLRDRTEESERILGIQVADKFDKFWQAVASGAVKVKEHRIASGPSE